MAYTICVGNYKGGVGKTKNCIMIAYSLANKGYKTLVIDLDPQGNASTVLGRTKQQQDVNNFFTFESTLMTAVKRNCLKDSIVTIFNNLDLLPSYIDFANYPLFLDLEFGVSDPESKNFKEIDSDKKQYFKKLLEPVKEDYDFILIDVPPTKSIFTDSAVLASNYILLVLQTQELALDGAMVYLKDLKGLAVDYNADFEICGILPVLLDNNSSLDKLVLKLAKERFGKENVFNVEIPQMARLKRFDNTGITNFDRHDRKVIDLYVKVADELLERIELLESELN